SRPRPCSISWRMSRNKFGDGHDRSPDEAKRNPGNYFGRICTRMDDTTINRTPDCPLWLQAGEYAYTLLEHFLNQRDRGKRAYLRISEKTAAQLYTFDSDDYLRAWDLVCSLEAEYQIITIKSARVGLGQERFEGAQVKLNPDKEMLVRHWLQRPLVDPYLLEWRRALMELSDTLADNGAALRDRPIKLPGKSPAEIIAAFSTIGTALAEPLTLRALSARCFWGDSKFLDHQEELVAALFPRHGSNLKPRPVLLTVHLPQTLEKVIFVENQDSFVNLIEVDLAGCALVYSAGFRASAQRIRTPGRVVFSYTKNGQRCARAGQFEGWWFQGADFQQISCFFSGDLDFSGMGLLKALRSAFPDISAWRGGYDYLLRISQAGGGHSLDSRNK